MTERERNYVWEKPMGEEKPANPFLEHQPGGAGVTNPLSPRQIEACALYAEGLVIREVAERMYLSSTTVDRDLGAARKRMGARTLGQLMFMLGSEVRGEKES